MMFFDKKRLGFTGTKDSMRRMQLKALRKFIIANPPNHFHHGDCINADTEAHQVVESFTGAHITIHPPSDPKARSYCHRKMLDKNRVTVCKPKPYLDRDHDIVDATDELLACPRTKIEQRRSGTWATIRYARKQGKPITLIHYDGTIERLT